MNPPDLKYSEEHEWVRVDADGQAIVGITEFAAESLGDVVFLDLPDVGSQITQFGQFGEVESVKAVSELYSPVSGTIAARNEDAMNNPELVNDSPYETGWLLRVQMTDASELEKLMTAEQYDSFLASQED